MTTEPLLSLRAQVLYRDREGRVSDVTNQNLFGLRKLAEDGALAIHILNQTLKRLDLLLLAAEHRPHVDGSLVRLAVQDAKSELEDGSHLAGYVHLTHELFEHSNALAPHRTAGERRIRRLNGKGD